VKRVPTVNNVFYQQQITAIYFSIQIESDAYLSACFTLASTIRRHSHELNRMWCVNFPHQVSEKEYTTPQDTDEEQVGIAIIFADLCAKLGYSFL